MCAGLFVAVELKQWNVRRRRQFFSCAGLEVVLGSGGRPLHIASLGTRCWVVFFKLLPLYSEGKKPQLPLKWEGGWATGAVTVFCSIRIRKWYKNNGICLYLWHLPVYSKVKCALVQTLRLCTGRTAHRGSRGIAVLFHDYGTRRGWGVSVTPRPLFTPGKDPVPIVQEAGWAPQPFWKWAENLAPTGIRSPDRPAHSESLYRLSYHGPSLQYLIISLK